MQICGQDLLASQANEVQLQGQVDALNTSLNTANAELAQCNADYNQVALDLQSANADLSGAQADLDACNENVGSTTNSLTAAQDQVRTLSSRVDELESLEVKSKVVDCAVEGEKVVSGLDINKNDILEDVEVSNSLALRGCIEQLGRCTNEFASNFDATATFDDDSCDFVHVFEFNNIRRNYDDRGWTPESHWEISSYDINIRNSRIGSVELQGRDTNYQLRHNMIYTDAFKYQIRVKGTYEVRIKNSLFSSPYSVKKDLDVILAPAGSISNFHSGAQSAYDSAYQAFDLKIHVEILE